MKVALVVSNAQKRYLSKDICFEPTRLQNTIFIIFFSFFKNIYIQLRTLQEILEMTLTDIEVFILLTFVYEIVGKICYSMHQQYHH